MLVMMVMQNIQVIMEVRIMEGLMNIKMVKDIDLEKHLVMLMNDRASPSMKDITGWEKHHQKTTLFQMVLQTADQEKLSDKKTPIATLMRSMSSHFNPSHLLETLVRDLANH